VEKVEGQRDAASGRFLLADSGGRFRLIGSRPVCAECGGPLFIEGWRPTRVEPTLTARDFEDEATDQAAA